MLIRTGQLDGAGLDWAVAKCEGRGLGAMTGSELYARIARGIRPPSYSTDWSQAGGLIEREQISLADPCSNQAGSKDQWHAWCGGWNYDGPTALVAAMRAYVASRLGAEVEVPEELV